MVEEEKAEHFEKNAQLFLLQSLSSTGIFNKKQLLRDFIMD